MDDFALRGFSFASSSTYTIVEGLGRGGMGVVYLVEKNCGGVLDYVVFKSFKTLDEEQEARLRNEANIATFLRHENIVKTYGLEYCKLSDMPEQLQAYFDWESWTRDLRFDYSVEDAPDGGGVYVFRDL